MTPEQIRDFYKKKYDNSNGIADEALMIYKNMVSEVEKLEEMFPGRSFTLDGHLIGSIGEAVAKYYYGIDLVETNKKAIDGFYRGETVQIKTVQQDLVSIDLSNIKDLKYLLVLYLNKNGIAYEVYNGPIETVLKNAPKANSHGYTQFRVNRLLDLSKNVKEEERIPNSNIPRLDKEGKNTSKKKKDKNTEISKFASWYIIMYSDPVIREEELIDTFDEECRKLGFVMDCGKMFEALYGKKAFSDAENLKKIIDSVDEITVLGSGIFSYWRYVTHWSYDEHLTDEKHKEWMLTALNRLHFLTSK